MTKKQYIAPAFLLAALSAFAAGDYPINFPEDTKIVMSSNAMNGIYLTSPSFGQQYIMVNQKDDALLYHDLTGKCFVAKPGETVSPAFNYKGRMMHGYIYLDRGNDGSFDFTLDADHNVTDSKDLMTYSFFNNHNSEGKELQITKDPGVNPPAFTLPADITPGLYRMRYKVDVNSLDPGGNTTEGLLHQKTIVEKKGAITDVMIFVTNAESEFTLTAPHCAVTDLAGKPLTNVVPGRKLQLKLTPDDGYRVNSVRVENGHKIDREGVEFSDPTLNYRLLEIPAAGIIDNYIDIPAEYTYKNVKITLDVTEGPDPSLNYYEPFIADTDKAQTEKLGNIAFNSGSTSNVAVTTDRTVFYADDQTATVQIGTPTTVSVDYAAQGNATELALYIDLDRSGQFEPADKVADVSRQGGAAFGPMDFTVAQDKAKPGIYRARLASQGLWEVDFLVNLHGTECAIFSQILNGNLFAPGGKPLPLTTPYGQPLTVEPTPTLPGFTAQTMTVRHGYNVTGRQFLRGVPQWEEFEIPAEGSTELTAAQVNGDIYVLGEYAETADSEWTLVWHDEFTADEMDETKWSYHPRYSSVWNRFIAVGDERPIVNKFEDGMYKSYCIKTPAEFTTETKEMISGAIYTANKFYIQGGYIEARAKTLPHKGNFQAFWMMPVNQSGGWPSCGELDIWEQIDEQKVSVHALHHAWRYPNDASVKNQFGSISKTCPYTGANSTGVDAALWHTFAIDWDSEHITWLVDGKPVGTAKNPHYSEGKWTEDVTWPFNKPFYIICNQSVGNGSWAAAPDLNFQYQTDFDYVRAYQKKGQLNYYSTADGNVSGIEDVTVGAVGSDTDAPVEFYTLQGVRVNPDNLAPGIYIRRQGSASSKVLIR